MIAWHSGGQRANSAHPHPRHGKKKAQLMGPELGFHWVGRVGLEPTTKGL